jgi:hypothetical protein
MILLIKLLQLAILDMLFLSLTLLKSVQMIEAMKDKYTLVKL